MSVYDKRSISGLKELTSADFPIAVKDLALGEDAVLYFDQYEQLFALSWSRLETDEEYKERIKAYEEREQKRKVLKMKKDREEFERMVKEYGWTT